MSDPFPVRELQAQFPLTAGWLNRTKKSLDATEETVGNNVGEIQALNTTSENLLTAQTNLETRADTFEARLVGAVGTLIGTGNTATTTDPGIVLQAAAVADATAAGVTVATADADATYDAAERDLLNEVKADLNTLSGQVVALKDTVVALQAALRTAGILAS